MIYLIGGSPKCGKTTLAKKMSKQLGIPWISSDTLQIVSRAYAKPLLSEAAFANQYPHSYHKQETNDETYSINTPEEIAKRYMVHAKASYLAIEMFILGELNDGNDYIIEGYHVTPELAEELMNKHGNDVIRIVFLGKTDVGTICNDFTKSTTPNDWVLKRTHKQETFVHIAEMISYYSRTIFEEAAKYEFKCLNMDDQFEERIQEAITFLLTES